MKILLIVLLTFLSISVFAHEKTDSVKVYGNCGMCKKRIEAAVKTEGVKSADWNVETKMLTITYDTQKTSMDDIQKMISKVGHDTEKYSADVEVYNKLPGCCLYERKPKEDNHSGHKH